MVSVPRRRTAALLPLLARLRRRSRRRRLHWVHPLNQCRRQQGDFCHLVAELRLDSQRHHQYFRMSVEQLDHLLSLIGPELVKQTPNYRPSIDPLAETGCGTEVLSYRGLICQSGFQPSPGSHNGSKLRPHGVCCY